MKKFAIGIPTLNRFDLLKDSLEKYKNDFKDIDIYIIDNGNQGIKSMENEQIKVHDAYYNYGVAKSWNILCQTIFSKYEFALILNDDIYLGYDTEVVNKAISNCKSGFIQSYMNWSVFLISKELYQFIGKFDEQFYPAYYEDSDYIYRMKLKGLLHDIDETLNPVIYRECQTYEKDNDLVNESRRINRLRYNEKWGNSPMLELYSTPYNKPNNIYFKN